MPSASTTIEVHGLTFEIIRSRRKTIGLYVYPDKRVVVRAPNHAPNEDIAQFVTSKLDWIQRKQRTLSDRPQPLELAYADGERHYYLGEPFQLRLTRHAKNQVFWVRDSLVIGMREPSAEKARQLLTEYYRHKAKEVFHDRLAQWHSQFASYGIPYPGLRVRKMKSRWGSCSSKGEITLNIELVKYPVELIDYVLVHELTHLIEFNHSPRFYRVMASVMPEWKTHKEKLEALAPGFGVL